MNHLLQDIRYGVRLLVKNPGFTGIAVLVLALGIGANTAVFSIINAMILQPIPSDGADIVGVYNRDVERPDRYRSFSFEEFRAVRESGEAFDALMAFTMTMAGVTEGDSTRRSFAAIVSADYFSTLRTTLAAGRTFSADEERPGSDIPVVIVGHQHARKAGLDPSAVLGKTVRINARDHTIVGIAPEGFAGTMALVAPEFWLPLGVYGRVSDDIFTDGNNADLTDPGKHELMLVGRLRPGLPAADAAPLLATVSARMQRANAGEGGTFALMVQKLPRLSVSSSPQSDRGATAVSGMLMGMAALVLLISCLNLANMLLARGTARRKEIALRLALGGARRRIILQLLTESLLIALLGAGAGLLLAIWGTRLLTATLVPVLPLVLTFTGAPDLNVLAATLTFAVLSTVLAGLVPAWKVTRPELMADLKEQANQSGGRRFWTMRNGLVVGQIALTLALLTAAGLFMRGAVNASDADPGFALDGILANVSPSLAGYDQTRGRAVMGSMLERVRSMPGVQSASIASLVPFGDIREGRVVQRAGTPPAEAGQKPAGVEGTFTVIGADYFDTLRLPVMRGRGFTPAEERSAGGTKVAIIDEPLARQLFGGADPIGERVQLLRENTPTPEPLEIVGVVAGVRDDMFTKTTEPHVYVPYGQSYRGVMNMHVRLASPERAAELAMIGTLRQELRAVDPAVAVLSLKTLRQHRDGGIALWAVNSGARLFTIFGAVALLLAVIGVYGVKSYIVSRRTREIGVRMALGATPSSVLWLVLREGLTLTGVGVAVGLGLSWALGRLLSGMLYEVGALDPLVFTIAPVVLTAAAMVASYVPARRATRVLPLTALRTE
jgi:predicted permease